MLKQYKKALNLTLALILAAILINQLTVNYIHNNGLNDAINTNLAQSLPSIELPDLSGELRNLEEWSGKPMVINFWATWCAPCLREIPLLKNFRNENSNFNLIGIAVDRELPVKQYAQEIQIDYPVLIGQMQAMNAAQEFGVNVYALPFTVFTVANGATLGVFTGELHQEQLDEIIKIIKDYDANEITLVQAQNQFSSI
ncbi:MAG: TlpA family protein disulfide reductase [Gammaproteobacteria bacterium]|jgi:thiol-disulfide isomerase/thioredoxin